MSVSVYMLDYSSRSHEPTDRQSIVRDHSRKVSSQKKKATKFTFGNGGSRLAVTVSHFVYGYLCMHFSRSNDSTRIMQHGSITNKLYEIQ